jgi:hypothetical protein
LRQTIDDIPLNFSIVPLSPPQDALAPPWGALSGILRKISDSNLGCISDYFFRVARLYSCLISCIPEIARFILRIHQNAMLHVYVRLFLLTIRAKQLLLSIRLERSSE